MLLEKKEYQLSVAMYLDARFRNAFCKLVEAIKRFRKENSTLNVSTPYSLKQYLIQPDDSVAI